MLWKERLGFARLAIEFGYPIVPFAAVGVEEMFDIIADRRTPGGAQVSAIMKRLVGMPAPPIVHSIGPTLIPHPERLYFWFGEPIDTARFGGRTEDDDAARQLRDEVRVAVQIGIEFLLAKREGDPRRGVIGRMLHTPAAPVADPDALRRPRVRGHERGGCRDRGRLDVALGPARGSARLVRRRRLARPARGYRPTR